MRTRSFLYAAIAYTFVSIPAFGCTCVQPPSDAKTAGETAQWYADKSDSIIEGTVKRVDLKWVLMETKVGGLVPTDLDQDEPTLQITLDVASFRKGVEQSHVLLTTGVGGGDCGFDFEIGKKYLVYAYADESGHLSTGICSGTRLLEESQTNVLRTKFCGHVVAKGLDLEDSQIFLIRTGNNSPIPFDEARVERDGSFCFVGTTPGNYRLAFVSRAEDSPTSFVFYPGVANPAEASTVELRGGQARPDLAFEIPPQPTFSVSGNVHIPGKSVLPPESKVFLESAEPSSFLLGYSKDVDSNGSFEFPRVLPGKYWAFVGVDSEVAANWMTRKVEVDVSAAVSGLSLELIHK